MEAVDTMRGIYHFLGDMAPKNAPVVEPKPRKMNVYRRDGKVLVARVNASGDLRESVQRVIASLGGLGKSISRGDKVLVKPNFNSPDPFPASTDLAFLRIVIELLQDAGAKVMTLLNVAYADNVHSYIELMRFDAQQLVQGLGSP